LTLTGKALNDPIEVYLELPRPSGVKASIPTDAKNGTEPTRLRVRFDVPKDAPLGVYPIRVLTRRGLSNFRLLCIDDLPEVRENDKNRSADAAQELPIPCVVNGRTDAEITDYYKFKAKAGQRLVIDVLGRRLGGQLDPIIRLLDDKGRQIAFSDDAPGLSRDARLIHVCREAGEYTLEVRDVRYAGGADYVYRIRIGDFPSATTTYPLSMMFPTSSKATLRPIHFAGPDVAEVPPVDRIGPSENPYGVQYAPVRKGSPPGWPVVLGFDVEADQLETEPNDQPAQANSIQFGAVSGILQRKGDRDHFRFSVKKGQRVIIDALTQEYGSPAALYLVLKDAKGIELAKSNPAQDPTRIDFTSPADGEFTLMVEHLHYWGGPEETYRLTIRPYRPGFTLSAAVDRVELAQGGVGVVQLVVNRLGYTGPIEVSASAARLNPTSITLAAGQTTAYLPLAASAKASLGCEPLVITARATIDGVEVVERLNNQAVVSQGLAGNPFPPRHLLGLCTLGVTEAAPFTLEVSADAAGVPQGKTELAVTVVVKRAAGYEEEIQITTLSPVAQAGKPPIIAPVNGKIAKGQNETKLLVKLPNNLPPGAIPLAVTARGKHGAVEMAQSATSPAFVIVPPKKP